MSHRLAPLARALRDRQVRYVIDDVEVPVARLLHIVTSKREAGRNKDKLFLATHREELEQLFKRSKDE